MKLTDMYEKPTMKKLNKVMEDHFGFSIDYDAITYPKAVKMSKHIMETVNRIRRSPAIHTAEKDPRYLEMLIVYEGLQRWLDAYKEQNLLVESEQGQAEVILAAKDMVDSMQDMVEKVSKMQVEQMPALTDSIRDQIGSAQAEQFKNTAGQLLATLVQQLGQAREQLDGAARALSGEEPAMGMGAEMPAAPEAMPGEEMPAEAPADEFGATDAAAGGTEMLGRERR